MFSSLPLSYKIIHAAVILLTSALKEAFFGKLLSEIVIPRVSSDSHQICGRNVLQEVGRYHGPRGCIQLHLVEGQIGNTSRSRTNGRPMGARSHTDGENDFEMAHVTFWGSLSNAYRNCECTKIVIYIGCFLF